MPAGNRELHLFGRFADLCAADRSNKIFPVLIHRIKAMDAARRMIKKAHYFAKQIHLVGIFNAITL